MTSHSTGRSLGSLIRLSIAIQCILLLPLWHHQSEPAQILGRYSARYAFALGAHLLVIGGWIFLYRYRQRLIALLKHPLWLSIWLATGALVGWIWMQGIESQIKSAISLNWWLVGAILTYNADDTRPIKRWILMTVVLGLCWLIPIGISALTAKDFSPDEAHWADYATSPYVVGGLYARTWLNEPVHITPGIGWSVAGYGWFLEHITFDIRVGRLWNMIAYGLAYIGIGVLAWRLYGMTAAWIAMSLSFFSSAFFPYADYRPDQQLPFALSWIIFAAAQARIGNSYRSLWHMLCGLFCALSLQLHAAGIYLAIGVGSFYLVEWLTRRERQHRSLIAFSAGASIGVLIYYVFNIAPIGGLSPFLNTLITERFGGTRELYWERLAWPSLLEGVVGLIGFGYSLKRFQTPDKLLLGLFACIAIAFLILDNWGYRTTYQAFFFIPLANMLADKPRQEGTISKRNLWLFGALLWLFMAQMAGEFINWHRVGDVLREGQLPTFTNELIGAKIQTYIDDSDVIVSTHELIWTFRDRPHFYSMAGEATAARRWAYEANPIRVWERIDPTVIIHLEGRIALTKGLTEYMEAYAFQVCHKLTVGGIVVIIYRPQCGDAPIDNYPFNTAGLQTLS